MRPWFTARKKFDPSAGRAWEDYVGWSKLTHLAEVISLDSMLCPSVLKETKDDYWPHLAETQLFGFFTDLPFLERQLSQTDGHILLSVYLNPPELPTLPTELERFVFVGFDLLEAASATSALTNCGGFPKAFSNDELNAVGLIEGHARAVEVKNALCKEYPEENHADCDLWAVFARRE